MQQARKEAQYIIEDARRTANNVYEELKQLRKQAKDGAFVEGSNEKQAALRRSLNEAEGKLREKQEVRQRPAASRAIRVGDTVELLKFGSKATVLAVNKDGSYQLQAGIMKVNAKPDEVYLLENETQGQGKKADGGQGARPEIRGAAGAGHPRYGCGRGACRCWITSWTQPIWAICRTRASSTARARACCARPYRMSCGACKYVKVVPPGRLRRGRGRRDHCGIQIEPLENCSPKEAFRQIMIDICGKFDKI